MRVGIIAEGRSDVAVLRNILKGAIGLDGEFTTPLRPELHRDETDLHGGDQFSNWGHVQRECLEGKKIDDFLASPIDDGARWIVIHIDAAEAADYGVARPHDRRAEDVEQLRDAIAGQMRNWLGVRSSGAIEPAIAVEETDAWVLPLYIAGATDKLPNVKERLKRALNEALSERDRKRLMPKIDSATYEFAAEVSARLRKPKELERCGERNASLKHLIAALRARGV